MERDVAAEIEQAIDSARSSRIAEFASARAGVYAPELAA
jgi:hypothetical protein